jgi:peptidoglycan hydrolase-like protein with peptidoglycan-binding domain
VLRARSHSYISFSQTRRERPRRRLRLRSGALSLAAVAVCVAVAGATVAVGRVGAQVLKRGDRGPGVAKVQRKLHLHADGVFGRMTERSLKRFQRRHGLRATGVVDPATRRALRLRARRASSPGSETGGAGAGTVRRTRLPRVLVRIAECESGGDPTRVSPDGRYRGKYQFTRSMWRRMGGEGDPAEAPEWLQDRLALRLYRRSGTAP